MSKKWVKCELELAIKLYDNGLRFYEIGEKLGRSGKSVKCKLNKLGLNDNKNNFYVDKKCENCGKLFSSLISDERKYCSKSCAAIMNNKKYPKLSKNKFINKNNKLNERKRIECYNNKKNKCLNCGEITTNKYCNIKCQSEYKRKITFEKIENGNISLDFRQYKKYLIHKHGEKCMECGWERINHYSGKIPIELEHIDGDSNNNSLDNLKLLCPNCHSLTPTYKALNTGNGRHYRCESYKKGKSY